MDKVSQIRISHYCRNYTGTNGELFEVVRSSPIQRGVKQGDVISPMLFNAGLEIAIRSWKQWLVNHGILLSDQTERLTNTRYADDNPYGKSLTEIRTMINWLIDELQLFGLQLNTTKTK